MGAQSVVDSPPVTDLEDALRRLFQLFPFEQNRTEPREDERLDVRCAL